MWLPGDINAMAHQVSQDIADGWAMLARICLIKQLPMEFAEAEVERLIRQYELSELEALRKVYHQVAYS